VLFIFICDRKDGSKYLTEQIFFLTLKKIAKNKQDATVACFFQSPLKQFN